LVALWLSPHGELRRLARDPATVGLIVVLANLADVDFLLGFVVSGDAHHLHGGITHSIAFAVAGACAVFALPRPAMPSWQRFVLALGVLLTHPLMDLVQSRHGPGLGPGFGVALLAPWSSERFGAPFTIFFGIDHGTRDKLLSWRNAYVMLLEIGTMVPLVLLADWWCRTRRGGMPYPRAAHDADRVCEHPSGQAKTGLSG
jgi:hypothetical protein